MDDEKIVQLYLERSEHAIPPHMPKILATFLGKIVRNLAFDKYKYNTAEKRGGKEVALVLEELESCVSGKDEVEKTYEYHELVADINIFLSELPVEKRNIFVCRYWYSDSISDIAQRYHMSNAAVSMILNRLRTRLHDYLVKRGYVL